MYLDSWTLCQPPPSLKFNYFNVYIWHLLVDSITSLSPLNLSAWICSALHTIGMLLYLFCDGKTEDNLGQVFNVIILLMVIMVFNITIILIMTIEI